MSHVNFDNIEPGDIFRVAYGQFRNKYVIAARKYARVLGDDGKLYQNGLIEFSIATPGGWLGLTTVTSADPLGEFRMLERVPMVERRGWRVPAEYADEVEHQDGDAYWDHFDREWQVREDLALYFTAGSDSDPRFMGYAGDGIA